jgi:hypothetical protein
MYAYTQGMAKTRWGIEYVRQSRALVVYAGGVIVVIKFGKRPK